MADSNAKLYQHLQANTPSIKTSTTALASNPARGAWSIQNLDNVNPLKVRLGSGASSTVFHYILKASTGATVGDGGILSQENGTVYTGIITVYSSGTPSYVVTEI